MLNIIFTFCKVFVLLYLGLSPFSNEGVIAPQRRAEGALNPAHSPLKSRKFVQVTNFVMNGPLFGGNQSVNKNFDINVDFSDYKGKLHFLHFIRCSTE